MIFLIFLLKIEDLVANQDAKAGDGATPHDITAAKINAYRDHLDKTAKAKSKLWQSAMAEHQSSSDQLAKQESKADKQKRAQGQTCFNSDGTLSFLSGYGSESHLRDPLEVIKELQRYIETDMLRLRQNKVEALLTEFISSMNHDMLVGKYADGTRELFQLRQNLWAAQNAHLALTKRLNGIILSKADVVRKMVSYILPKFHSDSYQFLRQILQ